MGAGIGLLRSWGPPWSTVVSASLRTGMGFGWSLTHVVPSLQSMADTPIESVNLDPDLLAMFQRRSGFIERTDRTVRTWTIISCPGVRSRTMHTGGFDRGHHHPPDLLQGESWREATFRPYDVSLEAAMPRRGRTHPLQSLIERILHLPRNGLLRDEGDFVQSAGWNMDALFIPQASSCT